MFFSGLKCVGRRMHFTLDPDSQTIHNGANDICKRANVPRPTLDRNDLELLAEIAESGSLIKAAKILRVHHATAFRRIVELEKRTGALLFERLPQGYVPTAAMLQLLPATRKLRSQFRELDMRVLEINSAAHEPLKVTTSDGLAAAFLPRLLRAFNDAHPDIVVNLIVENRIMSISEREVDIALRPARQVSGNMVCRKVGVMGYSLYASTGYVGLHGGIDAAHPDFSGHAICSFSESISYFTTAKWLDRHARIARIVAQCNSLISMQALARTGLCIAALPCIVGDEDPELIPLMPPVQAMETSLWVCTHARLRKAARVRAFLDFLYDAIIAERPRLSGHAAKKRKAS